jgi:UDP-3-O-[3-hydroxymyristoyl] glucosamine N-acyltransferase
MTEPGQYAGVPLVPLKTHIKMKAAMVHLPEMRRQLNRILKKLGLDADT